MKRQKHWFSIKFIDIARSFPDIVRVDTAYAYAYDLTAACKKLDIRNHEVISYSKLTDRPSAAFATYES